MNALVISGGGSKGAFAGGVAEFLMVNCQKSYDLFVGTSTGSLLAPLLAVGDIELAKKVYTCVTQRDIFTICPFIFKKGKDGVSEVSINHWGILKMFWRKEKTFGDTHNLRNLIGRTFPQESFDKLRASGKEVVVTVSNLTLQEQEYTSSNDYGYEDFCDWIWASACLVPFMSLVEKQGYDYGDGGFGSIKRDAHYNQWYLSGGAIVGLQTLAAGDKNAEIRKGVEFLRGFISAEPLNWAVNCNLYSWCHYTDAFFLAGGDDWRFYRSQLVPQILSAQQPDGSFKKGTADWPASWAV